MNPARWVAPVASLLLLSTVVLAETPAAADGVPQARPAAFASRDEGSKHPRTALVAFGVTFLGVGAVGLAYRRLRAQCELEEAERVLHAEFEEAE
jgi:hypothetical protein